MTRQTRTTPAPAPDLDALLAPAEASAEAPATMRVKCISDRQPFSSSGPLDQGEVYDLAREDAEILIANGFVELSE